MRTSILSKQHKPIVFFASFVAVLLIIPTSSMGQGFLGHEYEFDAKPIREGEQAVIPLDKGDPSYNSWRTLRDLSKDPTPNPESKR